MNHVLKVFFTAVLFSLIAISVSAAQVSRDSAITLVMDQVITPNPYNSTLVAFLYDPPGADSVLAAGTTVAPLDSAFVATLPQPKWFFWIDLTGDVRFEHPCLFVFVDPVNGTLNVAPVGWWPAITPPAESTVYPWESIDDRFGDSANRIYGSYSGEIIPPAIAPATIGRIVPKPVTRDDGIRYFRIGSLMAGNTCAILVGGKALKKGEENAWQGDIDSMRGAMTAPAPGGGTGMASETQEKNNATKADIQKMLDSAAAHGCNSIIFFYSGHGSAAGGGGLVLNGGNLSYSDLATMLNIAGLKFKNVILDNCFGGSSLNDFGGKSTTVTITTASDSTKTSTGTLRYYDRDTSGTLTPGDTVIGGSGKYTRAWMACWRKLRDSLNRNPTVTEIHNWVRNVNPDSINQKQNPSSSVIYPVITFQLFIPSPGFYDFLGTGVQLDFQNINGPFWVEVNKILGPPPGQIDPIITGLNGFVPNFHWEINQSPPGVPFLANAFFSAQGGFLDPLPPIPDLLLLHRPTPSISFPDPLWIPFPQIQGLELALQAVGLEDFSQWAFAVMASDTTIDVPHVAKWNMLSVPLQATDMHKDTLFPDAVSSAFAYNGGYTSEDTLEMGRGYWMKFDSAGSNALFGTDVHQDTFDVVSGWNMVGSITDQVSVGSVTTIPPSMTLSSFFLYDLGYSATTTIDPGVGYWVKASEAGGIILDGGVLAARVVPGPEFNGLNELEISDAAGNRQSLYFGAPGVQKAGVTGEMPPPPPQGIFDVRFGNGNFIEYYSGADAADYGVTIRAAVYPLTVRWEIDKNDRRELMINGDTRMSGRGSIVLEEAAPLVISAGGSVLPKQFSLAQNYPNPFNPVTKIVYELPADVQVKLTVFDLLGREVAVLADEHQTAGVRSVEFQGGEFPTGVYFYRIQAGNFTDTKKLMLMR